MILVKTFGYGCIIQKFLWNIWPVMLDLLWIPISIVVEFGIDKHKLYSSTATRVSSISVPEETRRREKQI